MGKKSFRGVAIRQCLNKTMPLVHPVIAATTMTLFVPMRTDNQEITRLTPAADRKNKRPFCASAPGACPLKPPAPPAGGHATLTALPVHSEARRSATPRSTPDVGHTPQDGGEEGAEGSHRGKASGQAFGKPDLPQARASAGRVAWGGRTQSVAKAV
jgi:hypothetical protein